MLQRKNEMPFIQMYLIHVNHYSVLIFVFIVHSIPVIIVQPFKHCKIVLEVVPASYAINRLCKCLRGNCMFPFH